MPQDLIYILIIQYITPYNSYQDRRNAGIFQLQLCLDVLMLFDTNS